MKITFTVDTDALADEAGLDRTGVGHYVADNYDELVEAAMDGARTKLAGAGIAPATKAAPGPTSPAAPATTGSADASGSQVV